MTRAFVLDGDKILCTQTATDWLPFNLTLTDSIIQHYFEQTIPTLGLVSLVNPVNDVNSSVDVDIVAQSNAANTNTSNNIDFNNIATSDSKAQSSSAPEVQFAISANFAKDRGIDWPDCANFISYRQLMAYLPERMLQQLTEALQLLHWQAETRFCSHCASSLKRLPETNRALSCSHCQRIYYPRIQPCIITAVTRQHPLSGRPQILLAYHHRYGSRSENPQYGLLAGFVEIGESLEQAVHREIYEEVGITIGNLEYLGSQPWPFPGNLMLGFHASHQSGDIVIEEAELSHADFFDFDNLPKIPAKGSIAYSIIEQVIARYKS